MATVIPTRVTQVDDRAGNHYEIFEVQHVTGTTTDVIVADSAGSVSELPADITAGAGVAKEASTAAGITIRNQTSGASGVGYDFAAHDGVKQVTIHADVASAIYNVVVRHLGSAAGTGSTGHSDL